MAESTTTPAPTPARAHGRPDGDSISEWLRVNSRAVTIGAIVAVALAVGYWLYTSSENKKEARAQQALADAERPLAAGNVPLAQADLEKLVVRYDGTHAAVQGSMMLAEILFDQKKFADGMQRLEKVVGEDAAGLDRAEIHNLMGEASESLGKPDDAAKHYEEAASSARFTGDKAEYRGNQARALETAGKKDDAAKIWQDLASDPTNPLADEARLRLGEAAAKPASKS